MSIKIQINSLTQKSTDSMAESSSTIIQSPATYWQPEPIIQESLSPTIKPEKQVDAVAIALGIVLLILVWGNERANFIKAINSQSETTTIMASDKFRQKIALEALSRVRNGENFRPGVSAQCMFWVRSVLESQGIKLPVSQHPFDEGVRGNVAAPGMAQSLSGSDIGTQIHRIQDLKPGDLVFYFNTYGNDPPGSITHVGIYVLDRKIAHRPTASGRVVLASVTQYKFGVAIRIHDKFLKGKSTKS
nr:NlpC/P60 family protein [Argonema antarcticum]